MKTYFLLAPIEADTEKLICMASKFENFDDMMTEWNKLITELIESAKNSEESITLTARDFEVHSAQNIARLINYDESYFYNYFAKVVEVEND